MRSSILLRAALLAASSLHADWVFQSFKDPAPDSAEVRRLYGVSAYSNPSSRTNLVVAEPGILKFVADTLLSEGTSGYSANIGLIHPLTPSWDIKNLTQITAISFEVRLSAKPTEGLKVSLVSPGYGKFNDEDKTHSRLLAPAVLPAAGVWKTFTLPIEDLTPPAWWTPPSDFPDLDSILKLVQALQFSPGTLYSLPGTNQGAPCTKCVGPTTPEVVMELRNVTLVGVTPPYEGPWEPLVFGCGDTKVRVLEHFIDGDATNLDGGSWTTYSDTSSLAAKAEDCARGTSTVAMAITAGDANTGELGFAKVTAGLHKTVPGTFPWRPYAGWAAISTDFGEGREPQAQNLTGISFRLRLLNAPAHVKGIWFKAHLKGVGDEVTHSTFIPNYLIDPKSREFWSRICVRPEDLIQSPPVGLNKTSFDPAGLKRLTWEVKIADRSNPSIASDSVVFQLSDLRLHEDSALVAVERRAPRASFSASYTSGRLTVQLPTGHHEVSVISPAGRVVFQHRGEVQALPVALDRGTWLVVTRGPGGAVASRKLVVLGAR